MKTMTLIALCGSLRKHSNNAALIQTMRSELLPADTRLDLHSLQAIPPYNEDDDNGAVPQSVIELRQSVQHADGLLIASPEYNQGISGVLKNALDWLSCRHAQSPMEGKLTLPLTASSSLTGGSRAQQQLSQTLWAMGAELVAYPPIVITEIDSKIDEGRLIDAATRQVLSQALTILRSTYNDVSNGATLIWA
ncbi:NADPH-dependent FMN reductase [Pseudomonas sp. LRF_L74]|uniref:NADPH-dependent FMN reductase n=1 Tax=Pseudomonas sp. LRF_L74 TaxID=3369422 RepID=UPI003F62FF3F